MCSNMKQLRFNFCSRPASCFGRFKQLHCCFSSAIYTIHPPFPFCQGFLSRGETVPRRPPSAFLGRPRAVSGKMVDGRSANLRCFLFLQSRAQLHFIAALSFLHKGKFHISLACKLYKISLIFYIICGDCWFCVFMLYLRYHLGRSFLKGGQSKPFKKRNLGCRSVVQDATNLC